MRKNKAKAVPLHTTKVLGTRGGIAPTHSLPTMRGQSHAQTAV
jgi:hypothetical protein